MSRLPYCSCMPLALAAILLCDFSAFAQGTPAKIDTVDTVRLNAVFYPSPKKNSPTVIMLHPIGEGKSIKLQGWKTLAETLQKNNYSVLMFDFRGHGDSTAIDDTKEFFKYPANRNVKPKEKETIEYRDYKANASAYLPILVNDIAAVKAYLDRKNDAGECNTSNTIVIGAESGGTLGAIWINSEGYRHKYIPPMMLGQQPTIEKRPEGKDIIAAVFLTPDAKLGSMRTVKLASVLNVASKTNAMPALFFFGKDDTAGSTLSKELEKTLKVKGSPKHDFIGAVDLDTKLRGASLLQDSLDTEKLMLTYLDNVVAKRGNEWGERDAQNSLYVWKFGAKTVPAKSQKGSKTLVFDDYYKFAQ